MAYKKLKYWFDKELADLLAQKITPIKPTFHSDRFIQSVDTKTQNLELKDRVEVMADALHHELGDSYEERLQILMQTLGPENEEETGMFTNFYWLMPMAKFVEKYGIEHFDLSMQAIKEITKRNTGEYTIRPFIEAYPQKTMGQLLIWAKDENRHVRRLASEGPRPRLPWASKIQLFIDDPSPILPILELLKDDRSKYVQKSVANCLNDILKDNPTIAKNLLGKWAKGASKERTWIIKHALRNLRKKADPWALQLCESL